MKKEDIFKLVMILIKIIGILLALISTYWIYLKITNHSPTIEEITMGIVMTHLAVSFPLFINIYKQLVEIKTTMKYVLKI